MRKFTGTVNCRCWKVAFWLVPVDLKRDYCEAWMTLLNQKDTQEEMKVTLN